ncbi:MAG: electron transporter RnfD, partial [Oscillospiraceae bacterium]|nr:electron transporter RnfD [Oscillospiraceae bacterium]
MSYIIPDNKKLIAADSGAFQYMGRIDHDDPARPVFTWHATCAETIFTGTSVGVVFRNIKMQDYTSLGYIIDGVQGRLEMGDECEDTLYMLAEGLEDKEHTLKIFKRLAAAHYIEFSG